MKEKQLNPDEYTFVTLMDTCFKENRPDDDAASYYKVMVRSQLRHVYRRLIEGLVKVGKVDEAKSFEMMVIKLRMNDATYKFIMNALFEVDKHDDVLSIIGGMLREDPTDFTLELEEFVAAALHRWMWKGRGQKQLLERLKQLKEPRLVQKMPELLNHCQNCLETKSPKRTHQLPPKALLTQRADGDYHLHNLGLDDFLNYQYKFPCSCTCGCRRGEGRLTGRKEVDLLAYSTIAIILGLSSYMELDLHWIYSWNSSSKDLCLRDLDYHENQTPLTHPKLRTYSCDV
ncbi:hypothetical protein M9H77_36302 [Catharanthus roseus]|uniref:Uncharacterized protein n=1 Tax=Catharanthus roseus TaxID=4058 RepID=A0ACB9ZVP4_CATRO|nr:hypothetical protein M9H77_36302 [Catharanthus roseus]